MHGTQRIERKEMPERNKYARQNRNTNIKFEMIFFKNKKMTGVKSTAQEIDCMDISISLVAWHMKT